MPKSLAKLPRCILRGHGLHKPRWSFAGGGGTMKDKEFQDQCFLAMTYGGTGLWPFRKHSATVMQILWSDLWGTGEGILELMNISFILSNHCNLNNYVTF